MGDNKMNLHEPKRKKHVKLKPQSPFPITLGDKNEWIIYTAHLTDTGSCVLDPNEIAAIHSMGYFGKGSLSRGNPSFGKARYGAPPVIKNRQWIRRQEWLKQFNKLRMESNNSKCTNLEGNKSEITQFENLAEDNERGEIKPVKEHMPDIIEIHRNIVSTDANKRKNNLQQREIGVSNATMNITEEDEISVITNKDTNSQYNDFESNNKEYSERNEKEEPYYFKEFSFNEDKPCFINNDIDVQEKLLVLPDSDSETENYLKNIKPRIECQSFPIQETLHLTFVETFFLLYGLGCLNLINFDGNLMNIDNAWNYFCKTDKDFVQKYVVYHYFRSKGWVVKPGLKYGGDFLLYKQGPPFYHASYIIIIDVLDGGSLFRDQSKSIHKLTWNNLLGLERLSETAAKEILFAQVLWPSTVSQNTTSLNVDILSEFSVRELLWRRWNPKHNKDAEDDDDDSC